MIFNRCETQDIFQLSQTCSSMREVTRRYWAEVLNAKRVLQPFFSTEGQMLQFLNMLSDTGAIVSGSTALQLFARTTFNDTDLDVYVERLCYDDALRQMNVAGFHNITQDDSKLSYVMGDSYPFVDEIERIQGLVCDSNKEKIIQIIATKGSPITAVLNFHSSKMINFLERT
jgi:hypothetical protein